MKSCTLGDTIGNNTIVNLSNGVGHNLLTLRRPIDKIIVQKHTITRFRLASVRTANPIRISINQ